MHTHVEIDQTVLLIYDIICQYIVYILARIGQHLPPNLVIDAAIGLFHVHAHKEQCFFQFAPTFIPGTGIVAGEILESLWSSLNAISPMARTATLANRAETLDDHASDSNHKKAIGMVKSLCRNNRHAIEMLEHSKTYYQNLTDEAGPTAVEKWSEEIKNAEAGRRQDVAVMNIYAAKLAKSPSETPAPAAGIPALPLDSWMELSLGVEDKQSVYFSLITNIKLTIFRLEIQAKVRQLGRKLGVSPQSSIETAREQLTVLVQQLKNSMHAAGVVEIASTTAHVQEPLAQWDEIANEPVPGGPNAEPGGPDGLPNDLDVSTSTGPIQIENQIMPLPSNGNVGPEFAHLEISHRFEHANHHLNRIRDLIAEKSFQFSHVIRVAPRKAVNTRSRAEVKKINLQIAIHCRLYTRSRARLIKLGADPVTMNRLQILTVEDIKASTAIVNPNEPGSTQLRLSWIWQGAGGHRWGLATTVNSSGQRPSNDPDPNLIECNFLFSHFISGTDDE